MLRAANKPANAAGFLSRPFSLPAKYGLRRQPNWLLRMADKIDGTVVFQLAPGGTGYPKSRFGKIGKKGAIHLRMLPHASA